MMKKIIAVCLVLMMLMTTAIASAEGTWAEGLSPQKPYSGSPEVDFNESIGYMLFMPLTETNINPGKVTLQIFMPRADVQLGSGTISLYNSKAGLIEEIPTDSGKITCREMTAEELEALIWGAGCVFEIAVEHQLEPNENYFVRMTEGAIVSELYGTSNIEIDDRSTWKFSTNAENYVENVEYCRTVEGKKKPDVVETVEPGDYAKVNIVLGEEAACAAIFCDAGMILPESTYFDASVETTVTFPSTGEVIWGVIFMDAEGNGIYSMTYTT